MIDLDEFMDSCKPYQDIIDKVTIDECISEVMGIGIWCNHEEMIKKAIVQRLLKAEKIRAEAIDKFAADLKEQLNQEYPSNYHCLKPYFSLENARLIVDEVAERSRNES